MSKQNKVNKNHYDQAGRLTPDEMGRERMNQAQVSGGTRSKEHVTGKATTRRDAPGSTRPRSAPGE